MEDPCLLNISSNSSFHSEFIDFSEYEYYRETRAFKILEHGDYAKIVAYVVLIVGGVFGNVSVILTVALNRSMRTTINFYVANLAVADLMVCLFCMLNQLLQVFTHPVYVLGAFMCKFNSYVQMTTLVCSVLTLSAISCDRFIAIMFPLHVRITKQRTSVVISLVWFISLVVSIPFLIIKKHIVHEWKNFLEPRCAEEWPSVQVYYPNIGRCLPYSLLHTIYYTFATIALFFLPVAIMVTAYSLILWRLWISEVPGERHAANINVQYRAKKKVIKMVLVVLIAFILCWMPLQVALLYSTFGNFQGQLPKWFDNFTWYSYYVAYANSFMNPIIYGGFNKTFREGFCVVLRCGFVRQRQTRPRISQRSRLTFTTGVMSSPSRYTSKILNGNATKSSKSGSVEMKQVYPANDGDISPSMKDTCVSISDDKEALAFT